MLQNIAIFLISSVMSFYISAVVLRFLLAGARADFYNPFAQVIVKLTNPPLVKLRRLIPAVGKLDTAAIVLALLLEIVLQFIIMLIGGSTTSLGNNNIFTVLGLAILSLTRTVIWIYIIAIILSVVISWVGNRNSNPIYNLADSLVEPILEPIRRYVPNIAGVDFSYFIALLGLQVVLMVIAAITF
ncbi:MAG: hypothetical protein RLZZ422_1720 [Pseudomonadota bacterium]|jgi:YggT family protein